MRHELKFAELQTPLFFHGINHGVKLDQTKNPKKLLWDDVLDKLLVIFKDQMAVIPMGNVASMTLKEMTMHAVTTEPVVAKEPAPTIAPMQTMTAPKKGRPSAQVSSPTSHVFEPLK